MNWMVNNWFFLVAFIAILVMAGTYIYKFSGLPTEKQLVKVKEWLLYAVAMAEKEMGGGTGSLKLRYVYDRFLQMFPWLVKIVTFEMFSAMVDEALDEMKEIFSTNVAVQILIKQEDQLWLQKQK